MEIIGYKRKWGVYTRKIKYDNTFKLFKILLI